MGFFGKLFSRGKAKESIKMPAVDYAAELENICLNSVEFKLSKSSGEAVLPGSSKFGGKPDLPQNFKWPYFKGKDYDGEEKNRPLSFLLQINCAEIKKFDKDNLLPESGTLCFFYELATMPWGFSPEDKDSSKVCYFPADEKLAPAELPADLEKDYAMPERALSFSPKKSLPCYEEYDKTANADQWEYYEEARLKFLEREDEDINENKLLGYAELIQGDMMLEVAAVANGFDMGAELKASKEEKEKLEKEACDWTLLLQFDSVWEDEEGFELMFGDSGRLYFYIKKEDLKNRKFDGCRLVLQCY